MLRYEVEILKESTYISVTWETFDTVAFSAQVMPYHAGGPHGSLPFQLANFPPGSTILFMKSRSAAAEIRRKTVCYIFNLL